MNGWLVDPPFRRLSPDRYHAGNRPDRVMPIEAVVIHYTASLRDRPTIDWLANQDDSYVSAHFVLSRDGTVHQLVPVTDRAIHAGGPTSRLFGRPGVNNRTIGIELMNAGFLLQRPDGAYTTASGAPYGGRVEKFDQPPLHPVTARAAPSRFWEPYSEAQISALIDLTRRLVALFPDLAQDLERRLVGHDEVDPGRKWDPGPCFPWGPYRTGVGGR
ncbi:MAG: N-acetylmuramoyl-L-alanine amidase [Blastochloris sp.]|nr:N-acetylmuramoyl-L-alanine amidase [Blastochloris sp.]